jgi:hypothetical protein
VLIQRLRCDVGFIGPNDRARLGICAKLAKVLRIMERLEYPSVSEQVGEVDIGDQSILESDVNRKAISGLGLR